MHDQQRSERGCHSFLGETFFRGNRKASLTDKRRCRRCAVPALAGGSNDRKKSPIPNTNLNTAHPSATAESYFHRIGTSEQARLFGEAAV